MRTKACPSSRFPVAASLSAGLLAVLLFLAQGCGCPTGQSDCSGACRDLSADPANCGACGTACAAGQVCTAGKCVVSCQPGLTECGGTCRDLQTDRSHCGACGKACAAGEVCSAGKCDTSCKTGLTNCNGSCRDLMSDVAHCGACAKACASGQVCSSGACTVSCQSGLTNCSGSCRDLTSDRAACGACDKACDAGQVCSSSACTVSCQTGLSDCGGSCRDLATDRANCGACATACKAGEVCSAGKCALSCQTGLSDCSGSCRDLQTDEANCGACATACPAGQLCAGGKCAASCATPLVACTGSCVDPRFDPDHCGGCGNACIAPANAERACFTSVCGLGPCKTGYYNCDADASNGCEIDGAKDPKSCGGCGKVCAAPANGTAGCAAGKCTVATCNTGYGDCDADVANGCETDTKTSNAHCGKCGGACATGELCMAGVCTAVQTSCLAWRAAGASQSGTYKLDPDGAGGSAPFDAYCDMAFQGGGWLSVYNQPKDVYSAAQMYAAITKNAAMTAAQTPTVTSAAIYTSNIPLAQYTQVAYGWAPANSTVTRWATYTRTSLKGQCYIDGYCGDGVTIAGDFTIQPQGLTNRDLQTGNVPSYPHVGIGWTGQQIVWGYDLNASSYGNWGNFNLSSCCNTGNTAEVQDPGWRYVIYIR